MNPWGSRSANAKENERIESNIKLDSRVLRARPEFESLENGMFWVDLNQYWKLFGQTYISMVHEKYFYRSISVPFSTSTEHSNG
jgi:hypothetical protein